MSGSYLFTPLSEASGYLILFSLPLHDLTHSYPFARWTGTSISRTERCSTHIIRAVRNSSNAPGLRGRNSLAETFCTQNTSTAETMVPAHPCQGTMAVL